MAPDRALLEGEVAAGLLPASPAAGFATPARGRVTPEGLRGSLRRRGLFDLGVFASSFAAALALSSLLDHSSLGWRSLLYVGLLMLPALVLNRLPAQRCPACKTTLESIPGLSKDTGLPLSLTSCPRCEVSIE